MSYAGFGIQSMNTFQKPRRVFLSIFEEILPESPKLISQSKSIKSWKDYHSVLDSREAESCSLSCKIYLVTYLSILISFFVCVL